MNTVRTLVGAAIAAIALSGCASRHPCRSDDGCCKQVWVPPHCDVRVAYCVEPPRTHARDLPVMGLCHRTETDCVERTRTAPEEVTDTCERRVPTVEYECLPCYGYRAVEDRRDVLVPVCGPHCVPVTRDVCVPDFEERCDACGRPECVRVGWHEETVHVGDRIECKQVGERLATVPAGGHLERVKTGRRNGPVVVGEHVAIFTTGTHVEQVPVWTDVEAVARDGGVEAREVGTRRDVVEKLPWRYAGHERPVEVPGFCATVCDDPRHHHRGIVITSAEYAEFLKAAGR